MKHSSKKKLTITYLPPLSYIKFYHTYIHWYQLLKKSTTWDIQKRQRYQNKQLQSLITHVYKNVPYYHKLFESIHLKPKKIKTPKDLETIPVLTKDIIRKNQDSLKAQNYPFSAFHQRQTGGTTNNPLSFYVEKAQWLGILFAFNTFYMKKAGYHSTDKTVSFSSIKTPIRHHWFFRTIECSSFHTTEKDFDTYNNLIHKFKPRFINTFPSIILLFTKDLIERDKKIYPNIDSIFCHGEYISQQEKYFLAQTYHCDVYDQYGHREQCVFATTFKDNDSYQINPEYGIVELVDDQNKPIHQQGKTGEIIATSLTNQIFPFIRYKTGDLSSFITNSDHQLFPCLLSSIQGRTHEFLLGKNHEKIPFIRLANILSNPRLHLNEYQIIQHKKGEIQIVFTERQGCSPPLIPDVKHELKKILEDHIDFFITPVDTIQRTPLGKYKHFIQKISPHHY